MTKPQLVPVADKWRLQPNEAAALCGISTNYMRELEANDQFPPRIRVRSTGNDEAGKVQYIASEVRAWADGRDWRAMVAARQAVQHAS